METDIDAMKAKVKEMEMEAMRLRDASAKVEEMQKQETQANQEDIDSRSVYVGNVDYGTTPEELQAHFQSCGTINRVTILVDKYTGNAKGCAYLEFADASSIANAMILNESLFRGRLLSVTAKRTNIPAFMRGVRGRGGRGRPFRGRGGPRGRGRRPYYAPY